MLFKTLTIGEEKQFRDYARDNEPPDMASWEVYHPVCREVWTARGIGPEAAEVPTSFAPEVIADSSGEWCGNALRFATRAEAELNVQALMMRWMLVRETRVVESKDPVNYRYENGQLTEVK